MEEPFAELMKKVADRDDQAAALVFTAYARRLVGLARKRLDERIQTKVDPEDIAQSVLKSFFARQALGQFEFANEDGLWALLTEITLRKCGKWNRYFRTRKRGIEREIVPTQDDSWQLADSGPAPEDVVVLNDTMEHAFSGFSDQSRKICEARLQGYTPQEIANLLDISERTVFRNLKYFRERLESLAETSEGIPPLAETADDAG